MNVPLKRRFDTLGPGNQQVDAVHQAPDLASALMDQDNVEDAWSWLGDGAHAAHDGHCAGSARDRRASAPRLGAHRSLDVGWRRSVAGLRAAPAVAAVQIVLMTGTELSPDEASLCDRQDFPVLRKPFLAHDILGIIQARLLHSSAVGG